MSALLAENSARKSNLKFRRRLQEAALLDATTPVPPGLRRILRAFAALTRWLLGGGRKESKDDAVKRARV